MNDERWLFAALALAMAACGPPQTTQGACGAGDSVTADGVEVCVYEGELIEEGFTCPQMMPNRFELADGGAVCAPEETLPPQVEAELEQRGFEPPAHGWHVVEENNGAANNGATNNGATNNGPTNNGLAGTPVTFRMEYTTDVPEDVWAQSADARGFIGWVRLVNAPQMAYSLDPPCDVGVCGAGVDFGTCAPPSAEKFVDMAYDGSIEWTWDGVLRDNSTSSCYAEEAAPDGSYTVEFCLGWTVTEIDGGDGQVVDDPQCTQMSFDHPNTPEVLYNADFGGN